MQSNKVVENANIHAKHAQVKHKTIALHVKIIQLLFVHLILLKIHANVSNIISTIILMYHV